MYQCSALFHPQVISPTTEHLFQALNNQQMGSWVSALQETTEEALKRTDHRVSRPDLLTSNSSSDSLEVVPNAMREILAVPGNTECADCSSKVGESICQTTSKFVVEI